MDPELSSVIGHLGGGHWYEYVLYVIPVAIVIGSILTSMIRERRGEGDRPNDDASEQG